MLQKAFDLADEVLSVRIGIENCDLAEDWHQIVAFHLQRSQQAISAIRLVLGKGLYGPAVVLRRHLFELAVNIKYLHQDPETRVPIYLEHYRVMTSLDEVDEIDQELQRLREQEDHVGISKLLIPGRSWETLKGMCDALGCLDDYFTMYRGASELAHGGGHGVGLEMLELLGKQQRPDYELPGVLLSALIHYGWVIDTSCKVFPYLTASFQLGASWDDDIKALQAQVLEELGRTLIQTQRQ